MGLWQLGHVVQQYKSENIQGFSYVLLIIYFEVLYFYKLDIFVVVKYILVLK